MHAQAFSDVVNNRLKLDTSQNFLSRKSLKMINVYLGCSVVGSNYPTTEHMKLRLTTDHNPWHVTCRGTWEANKCQVLSQSGQTIRQGEISSEKAFLVSSGNFYRPDSHLVLGTSLGFGQLSHNICRCLSRPLNTITNTSIRGLLLLQPDLRMFLCMYS